MIAFGHFNQMKVGVLSGSKPRKWMPLVNLLLLSQLCEKTQIQALVSHMGCSEQKKSRQKAIMGWMTTWPARKGPQG